MLVKDVMTTKVVTVRPSTSLYEAVVAMVRAHISGLPVTDENDHLVGVLSEGDLLRRVELGTHKKTQWLASLLYRGHMADAYTQTHSRTVGDMMTDTPYSISEEASLEDAVTIMEERRVRRLPVLREGRLVGIVTRADIVRTLAGFVASQYDDVPTPDAEIRRKLLHELTMQRWAPVGLLDIEVQDGVVQLRGTISDERQRAAIRVAAENTEGVRAVHDHLVWMDAFGGVGLISSEDETSGRAAARAKDNKPS